MDTLSLEDQRKKYQKDLYEVYMAYKKLFIEAEDILEPMKFFLAPMIEHRDALDHIMRYFDEDKVSEKMVKELDKALAHELRAYFDTADFVCITVRSEISNSLHHVSTRKIKKQWNEYSETKSWIVSISEKISKIRQERNASVESMRRYQDIMDEVLKVYKHYVAEIEPKIRKSSFW